MATYRGRLDPEKKKPYKGILAYIFNTDGERVGIDSTDGDGIFQFYGLVTGWHRISFLGGNYTDLDSIDVFVTAVAGDPDERGIFINYPVLSVVEEAYTLNSESNIDNGTSLVKVDISGLDLERGSLNEIILQYRNSNSTILELSGLTIACVGDSITHGVVDEETGISDYPFLLENMLPEGSVVYNFGCPAKTLTETISGASYRNTDEYAAAIALNETGVVDVIIIGLGMADVVEWETVGGDFLTDACTLYETFKTTDNIVLFNKITPSFLDWIPSITIKTANILLSKAAMQVGAPSLIDLNSKMQDHKDDWFIQDDFPHPNITGNTFIADKVYQKLTDLVLVPSENLETISGWTTWFTKSYIINSDNVADNGDFSISKPFSLTTIPYIGDFKATFVDGTGRLIEIVETAEIVAAYDYGVHLGDNLDDAPPIIDDDKFSISADNNPTTPDPWLSRPDAFLLSEPGAVTDTVSEVKKLFAQPAIFSRAVEQEDISETDTTSSWSDINFIDWAVGSLVSYYILDTNYNTWEIESFVSATGTFTVKGTDVVINSWYAIIRHLADSYEFIKDRWGYSFDYVDGGNWAINLNGLSASTRPTNWITPTCISATYGFIITASDKYNNTVLNFEDMAYPNILVSAFGPGGGTEAIKWYFWDGNDYTDPNYVGGWFNDTDLYLRVENRTGYDLAYVDYRISDIDQDFANSSEARITAINNISDIPIIEGTRTIGLRYALNAYNDLGVWGPVEYFTVYEIRYKWDKTKPEWDPISPSLSAGFQALGASWLGDAPSDPEPNVESYHEASGPAYYRVYYGPDDNIDHARHFDSNINTRSVSVPGNYTTLTYVWISVIDNADNESDPIFFGSGLGAPIVRADVDGALRIKSSTYFRDSGDSTYQVWQDRYGIAVPIESCSIALPSTIVTYPELVDIEYAGNAGDLYTINGIDLNELEWTSISNARTDGEGAGHVWIFNPAKGEDEEYNLTGTSGFNFGAFTPESHRYIFRFDPMQDKYFWRAVFKNANIVLDSDGNSTDASDVAEVHFDSILAADLIVGGTLRLETGLSIWGKTGEQGMTIDQFGLAFYDHLDSSDGTAGTNTTKTVHINGQTGAFIFGKDYGENPSYVKWEDGVIRIRGNLVLENGTEITSPANYVGYWSATYTAEHDGLNYLVNDIVSYVYEEVTNSYICIVTHASDENIPPTNTSYWNLLTGTLPVYSYYLNPTLGTAIKNHNPASELAVYAMKNMASGGAVVLVSGNSEGLSIWDENDVDHGVAWENITYININNSLVLYLATGEPSNPATSIYDSLTLVDITDGDDATVGSVTANPTLCYTRPSVIGAWTPSDTTTELTGTFYRSDLLVGSHTTVVTLNEYDGTFSATAGSTGFVSVTIDGNNTAAITLNFTYNDGIRGAITVSETVFSLQGGLDGAAGSDGAGGMDAKAVRLTVNPQAIRYHFTGNRIYNEPNSSRVTATPINHASTVYYDFYVDDVFIERNTLGYVDQSVGITFNDMPLKMEVETRDGYTDGDPTATDIIHIYGVIAGTSAVQVMFSNLAHSIPVAADGTVTYTLSDTDIMVYYGANQCIYDEDMDTVYTFKVSVDSTSNITAGAPETTPNIYTRHYGVVSGLTPQVLTASVTYLVTVCDRNAETMPPIKVVQTFSVSREGSSGDYVSHIFKRSATVPTTPTGGGTYTDPVTPTGWSDGPPAVDGNPLYMSKCTYKQASGPGTWSDAIRIDGAAGNSNAHLGLQYTTGITIDETGHQVTKATPAVAGWNTELRSTISYTGGAYVTFQPSGTNKAFMMGLNSDPSTDANYTSIDYCWYCVADGTTRIYESGVNKGTFATYTAGSDLTIKYDNNTITYYINGVWQKTTDVDADLKFYLDSSFSTLGTNITQSLQFGPMGALGPQGPTGDPGIDGDGGQYTKYVFKRAETIPTKPADGQGGSYNTPTEPTTPAGWFWSMPADDGTTGWMSYAVYTDPDGPSNWSTAVKITGEDGLDSVNVFYLRPESGTAIKNSTGTLAVRAIRVTPQGEVNLINPNDEGLYIYTPTSVNKGVYWSGITATDIDNSLVLTLRNAAGTVIADSITLVDITDGDDVNIGYIESDPALSWSRLPNGGAWTPSNMTTTLTSYFYRSGTQIASYARNVVNNGSGVLTSTAGTSGATSCTIVGNNTAAITLKFFYNDPDPSHNDVLIAETVTSVVGGNDGSNGTNGYGGPFVSHVFVRSATTPDPPTNPAGTYAAPVAPLTPITWYDAPPAGSNPLYMSTNTYVDPTGPGSTWSTPSLISGTSGLSGTSGTNGLNGTSGSSGAAGVASRGVSLTSTFQAFYYRSNNAIEPMGNNTATITATAVNTVGTLYYQFYKYINGTNGQSMQHTTSNTYSYSAPTTYTENSDIIEVHLREGSTTNPILARDIMSLNKLKQGANTVSVSMSNETHSLPAANDGTVLSYANSGTEFKAWIGNLPVPFSATLAASPSFNVTAAGTLITPGTKGNSTYICTYGTAGGVAAGSNAGVYITFTIDVKDNNGDTLSPAITRIQSFSKSPQGTTGPTGIQGVPGDGGQYTRYYFRRRATAGSAPNAGGGTYDVPAAPTLTPTPDGTWYLSMPTDNGLPGWMTACVYLDTTPAQQGWSIPVQITGEDGASGTSGTTGAAGTRGSVRVTGTTTITGWSGNFTGSNTRADQVMTAEGLSPIKQHRDSVELSKDNVGSWFGFWNANLATPAWQEYYLYVPGSMVVDGTITATALDADSIFSQSYAMGTTGNIKTTGKGWWSSTPGIILGYDSGGWRFELASNGTNYMRWDGQNVFIVKDNNTMLDTSTKIVDANNVGRTVFSSGKIWTIGNGDSTRYLLEDTTSGYNALHQGKIPFMPVVGEKYLVTVFAAFINGYGNVSTNAAVSARARFATSYRTIDNDVSYNTVYKTDIDQNGLGGSAVSVFGRGDYTYRAGCFIGTAQVTLSNGKLQLIKNLKEGDEVKTQFGTSKIEAILLPKLGLRALYSFNNGPYFVTAEHPFYTKDGWKCLDPVGLIKENEQWLNKISLLQKGDFIQTGSGHIELKTIHSIEACPDMQLYNLSLTSKTDKAYYINGLLTHNKGTTAQAYPALMPGVHKIDISSYTNMLCHLYYSLYWDPNYLPATTSAPTVYNIYSYLCRDLSATSSETGIHVSGPGPTNV